MVLAERARLWRTNQVQDQFMADSNISRTLSIMDTNGLLVALQQLAIGVHMVQSRPEHHVRASHPHSNWPRLCSLHCGAADGLVKDDVTMPLPCQPA